MKRVLFIFITIIFAANASAQFRSKNYKHIMQSKSIYEIDAFLRDAHEDDPRREVLKPRLIKMMKNYIKTAHPADPRIKEMQKKIALLQTRNSTKITFEEITEDIKRKKIEEYKAKLLAKQQRAALADASSNKDNGISTVTNDAILNDVNRTNAGTSAARTLVSKNYSAASSATDDKTEEEFQLLMKRASQNHEAKTVDLLNKLFDNDSSSKETIVLIENKSKCNIVVTMEGVKGLKYKLPVPSNSENSMVINKGDYLFTSKVCGAIYSSQKTIKKSLVISLKTP